MGVKDLTTTIYAPKLSNLWWLIVLIILAIFCFFLYDVAEWGMFFSCLFAYISQLVGFVLIIDNKRRFHVKVADYGKAIRRLKVYEVLFIFLSLLIILVDLAPFNIWVGSRWLINLYWISYYADGRLDNEFLFQSNDLSHVYYEGHWAIYMMTLIIILFIVLMLCYMVYQNRTIKREFAHFAASGKTKEQIWEERYLQKKAAEEKEYNNKVQKYGTSYKEIRVYKESIIVSEERSVIYLAGTDYKFQDILNVQIHDNSRVIKSAISATTKTKTGSMVGRAIVGDVIAGPVGGIIGGVTAKKQIDIGEQESRTEHNYSLYVTVNDLSRPVVKILIGRDEDILNEVYSILSIIINRNNR